LLGESDMMAYLAMMAPRLVELRRVLKPAGAIYLHCDQTASAHLRLLLDAIFGANSFQNEIVWNYGPKATQHTGHFQRKHDTILFYGKGPSPQFNNLYGEYGEGSLAERKTRYKFEDEDGQYRMTTRRHTDGTKYRARVYLKKGVLLHDVWDIGIINPTAKERLGYPTQKPEALLERIIQASSNESDIVLDPFCGCGTTLAVAQKCKRHWIGIDVTHLAVALMKYRLENMFGEQIRKTYKVVGEPVSLPDAKTLAANDPYQFQWWALGLVGARPVEQKKGADRGIDGRLYFHDEADNSKAKTKQIIISVKAGHVSVAHIRDLRGVIDREHAEFGVLISMNEPTKPMRTEAASGGFYKSPWRKEPYPRLQIFTIKELLEGRGIDCPPLGQVNVTFKKAQKVKEITVTQKNFEFE